MYMPGLELSVNGPNEEYSISLVICSRKFHIIIISKVALRVAPVSLLPGHNRGNKWQMAEDAILNPSSSFDLGMTTHPRAKNRSLQWL